MNPGDFVSVRLDADDFSGVGALRCIAQVEDSNVGEVLVMVPADHPDADVILKAALGGLMAVREKGYLRSAKEGAGGGSAKSRPGAAPRKSAPLLTRS